MKIAGLGAASVILPQLNIQSRRDAMTESQLGRQAEAGAVQYRVIPHMQTKVSTIGIGSSALYESSGDEIRRLFDYAAERGVNLVDTVMSDFESAAYMGQAMKGKRDKFVTQMHIGATYPNGTYTRTRDLAEVKKGFELQLKTFQTDYSDIGLIHYVDQDGDFDAMVDNGLLDYAQQLKKDGVIGNIGFSSHSVAMSHRFLDTGLIDVFMFSLNPAYDYETGSDGMTMDDSRRKLYERARQMGVAITVMKAYGGGRLLSQAASPFGKAMTPVQCIQYCLDQPAVVSVLPGVRHINDLKTALLYYGASPEERNYASILGIQAASMDGVCIYCGHCQPCVRAIDIASVNKFYDLAQSGDELARDHYFKLDHKAGECIQCGQCEPRCPVRVPIRRRMTQAHDYFGQQDMLGMPQTVFCQERACGDVL